MLAKQQETQDDEYQENLKKSDNLDENGTEWDDNLHEIPESDTERAESGKIWNESDDETSRDSSNSWKNDMEYILRNEENPKIIQKIMNLQHHFKGMSKSIEEFTRKNEKISKRLDFLTESYVQTIRNTEKISIENEILHDKVVALSQIQSTDPQISLDEIKFDSIRSRLSNLLDEYLVLEGEVCSKHTLRAINDQTTTLISEFDTLKTTKFRKRLIRNMGAILKKLHNDINELLRAMEREDTDRLEVNFDSKFVGDVEQWMEESL